MDNYKVKYKTYKTSNVKLLVKNDFIDIFKI